MKTLLIIANTVFVCYCAHLYFTFDPMTSAINRTVLEVVASIN